MSCFRGVALGASLVVAIFCLRLSDTELGREYVMSNPDTARAISGIRKRSKTTKVPDLDASPDENSHIVNPLII